MKLNDRTSSNRLVLYLILLLVFAFCLRAGWHDFDPWISREAVRENIRSVVRGIIQLAVQYFIPVNILVFFAQEIVTKRRAKVIQEEAV